MAEAKHTPEPWHVGGLSGRGVRADTCGIAWCFSAPDVRPNDPTEAIANAHRIVACVNSCAGIDPEAVPKMLEALKEIAQGKGPWSSNPLMHASNTIEAMVGLAKAALEPSKSSPSRKVVDDGS